MEDLKVLKQRAAAAQKVFDKYFPDAKTALHYKTPFQLLIATILSAQCTDVLVNKVTEKLFKKYKTPADFAKAKSAQLAKDIYPVTFYTNKAKSVQKTAQIIHEKYKDKVPKKLAELIELPGVARKTANVVLGNAYGIAEGIVVDTHIIRVSNRLGLTKNTDPKKIEQDLMKIVPEKNWIKFSNQMIWYGRKICTARVDKCAEMDINLPHFKYIKKKK